MFCYGDYVAVDGGKCTAPLCPSGFEPVTPTGPCISTSDPTQQQPACGYLGPAYHVDQHLATFFCSDGFACPTGTNYDSTTIQCSDGFACPTGTNYDSTTNYFCIRYKA